LVLRRLTFLACFATAAMVPAGSMRAGLMQRTAEPAPADPNAEADAPEPAPAARLLDVAGTPVPPLHMTSQRSGRPASKPRKNGRELILTFDDGPDLTGTPVVLEELERRGLRAIFFVNGEHMVGSRPDDFARRDLVRRIAAQGHLVANHTLSHRNVCAEPDDLEREIDGNAEIIAGATGLRPLLFRSPYGARCRRLDQALVERDLLSIGWNIDPQEWKGGSEEAIVDYVTSRLSRSTGRAVLLLHDPRRGAVKALPRILDWIEAENERLRLTGGEPLVIRDYSVFLPEVPLPSTGLEPLGRRLAAAVDGAVAILNPAVARWFR
jgi:peptidoglycan/xylan/chitin deacetylase (PgdA/CDA1 family)